ncbi:unnamed protein product, partial [marine sediment metagenome]
QQLMPILISENIYSMEIKIIHSKNRKKTVSARLIDGIMHINAPSGMPQDSLEKMIENFKKQFEKRRIKKELNAKKDLKDTAQKLNQQYFEGKIKIESITYVTNQNRLFGSCHHRNKTIRLSHRLAEMPEWVRDYVIVHEMAHILEPNHGKAFWALVSRYPLSERARGFLMAKGFQSEEEDDVG